MTCFRSDVAGQLTRIFSDIHYGDRASQVLKLEQLRPLTTGVDRLVLNGDTLDTRAGPNPGHTRQCRADIEAFAQSVSAPLTFLTGNHDPDFSPHHSVELADGAVMVLHGDVLFDDIVPWGRDARLIREKLKSALGGELAAADQLSFEQRCALWRTVAASIPQRHQSERNPMKYALRFAADTVWPPNRFMRIFDAWKNEPLHATALVRRHRPKAQFVLLGHTHRPAIRRIDDGPIIINTGSFTAPFGGYLVDVSAHRLTVRRTESKRGEFRPGSVVAEFPLANR